jgi:hypothetical protein
MRKLILTVSIVLLSASADAGTRSLSLASSEQPAAQAVDKTEPKAVETVKPVEQAKSEPAAEVKPKRRHVSTEARVIYELHRHGIYW